MIFGVHHLMGSFFYGAVIVFKKMSYYFFNYSENTG